MNFTKKEFDLISMACEHEAHRYNEALRMWVKEDKYIAKQMEKLSNDYSNLYAKIDEAEFEHKQAIEK